MLSLESKKTRSTMSLERLPPEIIIQIVRHLDTKSIFNLWSTCPALENVISMRNVIKQCQFSMNTLATVKSLKSNFFQSVAGHLQELDVSCVYDLSKTALMPVMAKMKCLRTLNISYTKITTTDLLDLYEKCSTIKNISINFRFTKESIQKMKEVQDLFSKFDNVEFVGTMMSLFSLLKAVLCKAKLQLLRYVVSGAEANTPAYTTTQEEDKVLNYQEFNAYFLNWNYRSVLERVFYAELYWHTTLGEHNRVVIIYKPREPFKVTAPKSLKNFFMSRFKIDITVNDAQSFDEASITSQYAVIAWPESTVFDRTFFNQLYIRLKDLFNQPLDWSKNNRFTVTNKLPAGGDKGAPSPLALNLDHRVAGKDIEMNILFECQRPITLPENCYYLKELKYLSLTGNVSYSEDFFDILFRSCVKLKTLNIEGSPLSKCESLVAASVPLSTSLKNFRLVDGKINLKAMFAALSQCKSLENIQLKETDSVMSCRVSDPTQVLTSCNNLYYFSLHAYISDSSKVIYIKLIDKVKAVYNKQHIAVVINNYSVPRENEIDYRYDPFINVFKLYPVNSLL